MNFCSEIYALFFIGLSKYTTIYFIIPFSLVNNFNLYFPFLYTISFFSSTPLGKSKSPPACKKINF